jgi:thioredoxin reductase (NADPH)
MVNKHYPPEFKADAVAVVEEILGSGKVVGARLRNVQTGGTKVQDVTGVFVAIGHDPAQGAVQGPDRTGRTRAT